MKKYTREEILAMTPDQLAVRYRVNVKRLTGCVNCKLCKNCISCVGCVGCENSTGCASCKDCYGCENCYDSTGCVNCVNCRDCHFSQNLKNARHVVSNVQLTEDEYEEWIKK